MASFTWSSSLASSPFVSLSVSQSSKNIVGNYSSVSFSLVLHRPSVIYSSASKSWSVSINGVKFSGSTTIGGSGDKIIKSGSVKVNHNSDGSKSISVAFSLVLDISWSGSHLGSASKSGSVSLSSIPRASSFSASAGSLGSSITISISRASSSFTHTLSYSCGSASGYIATKSSASSISWSPPLSLASQNKTGSKVSLTLKCVTYSGSNNIGSSSKSFTFSIPASVKPSVSFSVSDANGFDSDFSAFVKGKSKLTAIISAKSSYGADIVSYKLSSALFDSLSSSSNSITSGILNKAGSFSVSVSVTDKRGRSASASKSISVIDYSVPVVSFSVHRCNFDGVLNDKGAFCKLDFSFSISRLNNFNVANYRYKFKKSSDSSWVSVDIDSSSAVDVFNFSDFVIFECDSNSAYDIVVSASDFFNTVERSSSLSTAFTLLNFSAGGTGIGVGGVSSREYALQVFNELELSGGLAFIQIANFSDFDDLTVSGFFKASQDFTYYNIPSFCVGLNFSLEIIQLGSDFICQRITCFGDFPVVFCRFFSSSWSDWLRCDAFSSPWVSLSLSNDFKVYSESSSHLLKCRRIGDLVYLKGQIATSRNFDGSSDTHLISSLPVGFRPAYTSYFVQQGSGTNIWTLSVYSSGEIYFSRYRSGSSFVDITPNHWLPVYACFPIS